MKKWLVILIFLPFMVLAQNWATTDDMGDAVRVQTSISSSTILTQAVLYEFVSRAVSHTSTDIGGFEMQFQIQTVAGQAFYAIPDSIIRVMYATIISNDRTKSFRAFPPQFSEEILSGLEFLDSSDADAVPIMYNFWADTMQVIPTAVRIDSIYLKCFINHGTIIGSTSVINLDGPYSEAAFWYACALVEDKMANFGRADRYFAIYDKRKLEIEKAYLRRIDLLRTQ